VHVVAPFALLTALISSHGYQLSGIEDR